MTMKISPELLISIVLLFTACGESTVSESDSPASDPIESIGDPGAFHNAGLTYYYEQTGISPVSRSEHNLRIRCIEDFCAQTYNLDPDNVGFWLDRTFSVLDSLKTRGLDLYHYTPSEFIELVEAYRAAGFITVVEEAFFLDWINVIDSNQWAGKDPTYPVYTWPEDQILKRKIESQLVRNCVSVGQASYEFWTSDLGSRVIAESDFMGHSIPSIAGGGRFEWDKIFACYLGDAAAGLVVGGLGGGPAGGYIAGFVVSTLISENWDN